MYAHSAHIGLHTKECALMPSPWDDCQNMLAWLDSVEAKGNKRATQTDGVNVERESRREEDTEGQDKNKPWRTIILVARATANQHIA